MDFDALLQEAEGVQAGMQTAPPPPARPVQPPEPLSTMDKLLAKVPSGLVNNPAVAGARNIVTAAASPLVGGAQFLAHLMPDSTGVPALYDRKVSEMEAKDRDAQAQQTPLSAGINEFAGSAISPTNLAMALRLKPAVTVGQRALQGAGVGAVTGLTQPVEVAPPQKLSDLVTGANPEGGKYFGPKAAQVGIGTATGAVLQPIIGAIGDKVLAKINSRNFSPSGAAQQADDIINNALAESSQKLEDLPPERVQSLRQMVTEALSQGKSLDAAAAMRLADFKQEGIQPLQGWITRDPMQFAAEQNVRGVKGAGEEVSRVITEGNRAVTSKIGQFGNGALEPYQASPMLADALRKYDAGQQQNIATAYATAKTSAGKDLELPTDHLLSAYGQVVNDFGDKVPQAVRSHFEALAAVPPSPVPGTAVPGIFKTLDASAASQPGPSIMNTLEQAAGELQPHGYGAPLSSSEKAAALPANYGSGPPRPSFTFEDANRLRGVLNAHVGSDPTTNKALGILRAALNNAQAGAGGGPFAPATKLAAARFQQLEQVPAIADAVNGNVDDKFVQRQVINNPSTPQVQKLAALLREQAPDAYEQVRQQIGSHLYRSAFGDNAAGDVAVGQASYNKALRNLGTGKLEAFFQPEEVDQLKRLGRIASNQVAPPAGAASNYSNTASTIANLLRATGGFIPIAKGPVQFAGDKLEAAAAVRPSVPVTPNLTDEQRLMLSRLLVGSTGAGAAALSGFPGKQP